MVYMAPSGAHLAVNTPHSPHEYWIDNKNVIGTVLMGSYLNSVFKAEAVLFCFLPSR